LAKYEGSFLFVTQVLLFFRRKCTLMYANVRYLLSYRYLLFYLGEESDGGGRAEEPAVTPHPAEPRPLLRGQHEHQLGQFHFLSVYKGCRIRIHLTPYVPYRY